MKLKYIFADSFPVFIHPISISFEIEVTGKDFISFITTLSETFIEMNR